ncbi:MAG: T9SS type A sorting domain-containing protein [Gilvibacter sp.]
MKYLLILLLFSCASSFGQIIDFPDPNLKSALVDHNGDLIDTNGDNEIQIIEANEFTGAICLQSSFIHDLTGIEHFINAIGLDASTNELTEVDLSNNIALKVLKLISNDIAVIDLSSNILLEELWIAYNDLTELDVSENTALKHLSCKYNLLTNLIINGTNLERLICNNNQLTELNLTGQSSLKDLWCNRNLLTNLDLSETLALEDLDCAVNLISSIELKNLSQLKELSIGWNFLTNIDVSDLVSLESLGLTDNSITSLEIINSPNINAVYVGKNLLTSLTVISDNFRHLSADDNLLRNVNLTIDNGLGEQVLVFSNNLIKTIDLTRTRVSRLWLRNNPLLTTINIQNGENWRLRYPPSSDFLELPSLESICLDLYGGADELIAAIQTQVGPDVNFYNNETCDELILSTPDNSLSDLIISPNPATELVQIDSSHYIKEVQVYSITGQLLKTIYDQNNIDLSSLQSGIYILKVFNDANQETVQKIVKK